MPDINKIKNHPGFMPFGSVNVKTTNENTQSEKDKEKSNEENTKDSNI